MSGRQLKVDLIANTSQFKSAMAETAANMRTIKSEMRATSSETDRFGNRVQNKGARIKQLNGLMTEYRTRIKAIKDEQKHLTNEYKKGNITEKQHADAQRELATRLNNTQAAMNKTEAQLKKLNAEGTKSKRTFADFDKSFRNVGTTMRNVGLQAGITAGVGFAAMKRVMGSIVTEANEFHQGMAEVKAISGATGDEMEKLTQQAKDLGRATKYTAFEAAEAMANLARAGFKTNEIYSAMPGLLDLAASSNLDLGQASDITANILRTFNKNASESGKVADVLAKGAATANTDVSGLGESMKTAGSVAQSLGIQFESVAAATGLIADAGIDGSSAGRMLRQGMLRLSKPTGEAAKLIKDLGINVFDADGNMKSLDKVVGELNKGLKGQTKQQKAAALATIFGSESTAGWTVLLDQGADSLKNYTDELIDSEGAAKDMADTMQDTAEGAIIRMQSAISGLKIELGEKLAPTISKSADGIGNFANKLSEIDSGTIETVAKLGLLVTATLGVTTVVAGLVAAIGAFMAFAGSVGVALTVGAGLVTALGVSMATSKDKAKEYNGELGKQADTLEGLVDKYDKLRDKANLTSEELGRLKDIQQELGRTNHPEVVERLQAEYEQLAKKSGLSKNELEELLTTNDEIIKQSPDVETAITNEGNAIVDNTDKVREYIAELRNLNRTELEIKRAEALVKEKDLLDEIAKKEKEINETNELRMFTIEAQQAGTAEHGKILNDVNKKLDEAKKKGEDTALLEGQRNAILEVIDGNYQEHLEKLEKKKDKAQEIVDKNQQELDKNKEIDGVLADAVLKEAGINEEGQKGLITLEEKLAKNHEQLGKLDEQLEKNGQLTQKEQEKYDKLVAQNEKYQEAQGYILEELGLHGTLNSLIESKKHLLSDATNEKIKELAKTQEIKVEEGNVVKQIQDKNSEIDKSITKLQEEGEAQGLSKKEISAQIKELQNKKAANNEVIEQILKELGLWDSIDESIKDGIRGEKEKGKATDDTTQKQKNQGKQIDENNKKTETGIKKEQERTKEAGKSVNKEIVADDKGRIKAIDKKASESKNKSVIAVEKGFDPIDRKASTSKNKKVIGQGVNFNVIDRMASQAKNKRVNAKGYGIDTINREASKTVTKRVNVFQRLMGMVGYAKGTPKGGHPGGMAMIGEEGRELVHLPDGRSFISPSKHTILGLPKGTHVIPNRETETILKNTPRYANGTPDWQNIKNSLSSATTQMITHQEILKVEHEINNKPLENKLTKLENTIATLTDTLISLTKAQQQQMRVIAEREMIVEMDSEKVGKATQKAVNKKTDDETKIKLQMLGII